MQQQFQVYDLHIHTKYSPDSTTPLEAYAKTAEESAIHIGFLDHFELAFIDKPDYLNYDKLPQLFEEFDEIHAQYPNTSIGLEIDYYTDLASEVAEFCDTYRSDLDYLIGVVHTINRLAVTTREQMDVLVEQIGLEAILRQYFNEIEGAIHSQLFEGIAHLDGVMRFLPLYEGNTKMKALWQQRTLELGLLCKKKNILIEINLHGRNYPWGQYHPSITMINELVAAGAQCYVGSDSHTLDTFRSNIPLIHEMHDYLQEHKALGLPRKLQQI